MRKIVRGGGLKSHTLKSMIKGGGLFDDVGSDLKDGIGQYLDDESLFKLSLTDTATNRELQKEIQRRRNIYLTYILEVDTLMPNLPTASTHQLNIVNYNLQQMVGAIGILTEYERDLVRSRLSEITDIYNSLIQQEPSNTDVSQSISDNDL